MLNLAQLDADIAAAETQIRLLQNRRRAAIAAHIEAVLADFDAGLPSRAIAAAHGMTEAGVIALVWRSGRTRTGRRAARQRIQQEITTPNVLSTA